MRALRTSCRACKSHACSIPITWTAPARMVRMQAESDNRTQAQESTNINGDDSKRPAAAEEPRGATYYAGLLSNDIRHDNRATSNDMLVRNLQLAGSVAGLLGALLLLFMASNGLLQLPGQ
ncbi:hypothetical protein Vretimale_3223 [Volvox reticuliferus]|uniref:Uncharacterized protein n=1 Tax=Volvox reticuliferus TaxID=1737510 RepID=A0A8J4G4K0_9CHLO|nr:hypothetical protein Vretifemale_6625 [Volvox reticuliferus]GIL97628.1 hypothetical protein Vretimale_3223 [Volvox reticuliferus]